MTEAIFTDTHPQADFPFFVPETLMLHPDWRDWASIAAASYWAYTELKPGGYVETNSGNDRVFNFNHAGYNIVAHASLRGEGRDMVINFMISDVPIVGPDMEALHATKFFNWVGLKPVSRGHCHAWGSAWIELENGPYLQLPGRPRKPTWKRYGLLDLPPQNSLSYGGGI